MENDITDDAIDVVTLSEERIESSLLAAEERRYQDETLRQRSAIEAAGQLEEKTSGVLHVTPNGYGLGVNTDEIPPEVCQIEQMSGQYKVTWLSEALLVSRSDYYDWAEDHSPIKFES